MTELATTANYGITIFKINVRQTHVYARPVGTD